MATVPAGENFGVIYARWESDERENQERERGTAPDEAQRIQEPELLEDPDEVAAFQGRVARMAEEARRMETSETPIQAAFRRAREAEEKLGKMKGQVKGRE